MSDRMVALSGVVEGKTDAIMLQCFATEILGTERIVWTTVQPETSVAFGAVSLGPHGGGWRGVQGKCLELAATGIATVLANADALIIHLDGEVAFEPGVCQPPPARVATDIVQALKTQVMAWLGTTESQPRIVIAVPCMETEAWLLPTLRPGRVPAANVEVAHKPSKLFGSGRPKLVEQSGKKKTALYEQNRARFREAWAGAEDLAAAQVFATDLMTATAPP